MKRLLTVFFLMVSIYGFGQVPSNYLNIRSRYNLIAVKNDSGFHVPGYSTIPNYRGGVWTGSGNVGVDTVNHKFYFYSGGSWREAGATYTFTNGITESGGTVTLTNDTTAFANSFYGTNAVGRRGYRPLSEIIPTLQQVITAGNVLTANNLIDLGTTSRLRIKGGKLYDAINFTAYDPANNDSSHITISGGYVTAIAMGVKRSNAGAYLNLSNNGFDFQTVSGVKTTTRTVFQQYNISAITDSTGFIMGKDSFLLTKSSSSTLFQNLDLFSYNNAAKFKWSPNGVVIRNGIGFYDNHSSAILDVYSKTKGVLLTRHTTAEMLAVPNPANGLVTYNTDSLAYCYFNGTAWKKIAGSESSMAISGNYGNIQLNRNGALATPASDSLSFTDKLNVKGNIVGTSKLILGATSAPAQSQVYVTGGVSGGNIDARGDSTSEARDEANIEVEHPDYDGISHTAYGVAMQTNGNVTTGSLLTYPKKNSGQLRFTNETNVIRVIPNRSLRFATNNIERAVIDSNGRVGIGTKLPDTTLHIAGSVKIVDGYQGANKVLTDVNGDGIGRWMTPATVADTSYTTIATFTAGGGFASDTTMCTDSTLFGSFFTGQFDYTIAYIQAVIKGNAGDSIVLKLVYNDTFNVDGTKVNGAGLSINNRYTGNVFTISTNRTIAANTWVWLKPEAVIEGKKPKYISVTLVGYKTYVTP